jgi:hypothetical protein
VAKSHQLPPSSETQSDPAPQVTVQGFTNNNYTLTIMADPTSGLRPVIAPVANSTAAFQIMNTSVSIVGIDIAPTNAMTYGIAASSAYITISSVNVQDATGKISFSGIALSSWNAVSYTSITVTNANGFALIGSTMTSISYSSAQASGSTRRAISVDGASTNTITASYFLNLSGYAAMFINQASYNTVSQSTMISIAAAYGGLGIQLNSVFNTVSGSYMQGLSGHGAVISTNFNTITQSTMVSNSGSGYALMIIQGSTNTITGSFMSNNSGTAVRLWFSAIYNTISFSTINGGSSS